MFIDVARQLVEARSQALQELMGAWERVRLDFLCGRDDGTRMVAARTARREADGDGALFQQVQEAVLEEGLETGLDHRLQALFLALAPWQGQASLRRRQDEVLTALELQRLRHPLVLGGRQVESAELELLAGRLDLAEEREAVRATLGAAAVHTAPLAMEWLQLEEAAARDMGHDGQVGAQGAQLGLGAEQLELWLAELRAGTLPAVEADPQAGAVVHATLAGAQVLDLLRDTSDLLGLEVEGLLLRWSPRPAHLPGEFLGMVEGAEGHWPVALADLRPGAGALRQSLELLGRCLGAQAGAVRARLEDEETSSPFPLREVQARACGLVMASLPGHPDWSARLLGCADPRAFAAWWRRQEQAQARRDLLRMDWLIEAPRRDVGEWDGLWTELWMSRTGQSCLSAPLWFQDAALSLRPRHSVARVAAHCLAASLLESWALGAWPLLSPELGGHLLDDLTDPPAEGWADAMDLCRDRLDPQALLRRWASSADAALA